jgi:hypothetical protein
LAAIASEKLDFYADSGNALYRNISLFYIEVRNLSNEFRLEPGFDYSPLIFIISNVQAAKMLIKLCMLPHNIELTVPVLFFYAE